MFEILLIKESLLALFNQVKDLFFFFFVLESERLVKKKEYECINTIACNYCS